MFRSNMAAGGILKYFNLTSVTSSTSPTLPDPDGPLSEKVPAKAIKLANAELEQQSKETPRGRRSPYTILTPAQRYEVGKRASEHGVTASLRYFFKKYPQLCLKETTVRRLKNLYQSTLKSKSNDDGLQKQVQELARKKTGRPLLVTEELDTQLQEYIKDLRKRGLAINTSIVIANGRGIIMNKDANLLFENGGGINLTKDWAKYLMKRMGFVKQKACSKAKIDVEHFNP